ncbi:MAG: hypothetical protein WCG07_02035 [Candidatus Taylorbacteria bacterium]
MSETKRPKKGVNRLVNSRAWVEFTDPASIHDELSYLQLVVEESCIQVQLTVQTDFRFQQMIGGVLLKQPHEHKITVELLDKGGMRTLLKSQVKRLLHNFMPNRRAKSMIFSED